MFTFYVFMNFYDATLLLLQKMIREKQLFQKNYCPLDMHKIQWKDR